MNHFILRRNIASFRRLLKTETDLRSRRTLWRLLADAEADLVRLDPEGQAVTEAVSARSADPRRGIMESRGK